MKPNCKICDKAGHPIFYCHQFLKLLPSQRVKKISELRLCKNCFSEKHNTQHCKSKHVCKTCNCKHNTLLHLASTDIVTATCPPTIINENNSNVIQTNVTSTSGITLTTVGTQVQMLLPTAMVYVYDRNNQKHLGRLLLDSCSQQNYISDRFLHKLKLTRHKVVTPIVGINNTTSMVNERTTLKIKSQFNEYKCELSALVLPTITSFLPNVSFNKHLLDIPKSVQLADTNFNESSEVDMLIGVELFWMLLCNEQISFGKGLPVCQKTLLGWVISGPITIPSSARGFQNPYSNNCLLSVDSEEELSMELRRFWEIEEIEVPYNNTSQHSECENLFANTTSIENGRIVVKLPFNSNKERLGESFSKACQRFNLLEKKFSKDSSYKTLYGNFIKEYEMLDHMKQVTYSPKDLERAYFLPHHAVLKTDSTTTKLRVVFDASCKTTSNISLNDTLMVGGVVQNDLISILLDFRVHQVAFTADCEKMYRQVLVQPEDRIYQNIVWRDNTNEKLKTYQLNTVTYGTACAPFLATRALKEIALRIAKGQPEVADVINSNFYVDDLICAVDSVEIAKEFISKLDISMKSYGFNLRKWTSSHSESLKSIHNDDTVMLFSDESKATKVLGLTWDSASDHFIFLTKTDGLHKQVTKRSILSITSKLFDPLGLVAPVLVKSKLMIQALWQLKLSWDEPIPAALLNNWMQFQSDMLDIPRVIIPRVCILSGAQLIQLHGYADASERAYGACIYIKSSIDNHHSSNLLCAKSRVAPLKKLTLPRLELCAAVLLVRLKVKVVKALKLTITEFHYWSDSTITLAWIATPPCQLKTFVSNRVAEIIEYTTPNQWHHVSSSDNPADMLSRGISLERLSNSSLWWHGPDWLLTESAQPKAERSNNVTSDLPDLKPKICTFVLQNKVNQLLDTIINKYSSLKKLNRICAYIYRFIKNIKVTSESRAYGPLSNEELEASLCTLVKHVQMKSFYIEINALQKQLPIPPTSKILSLSPFLHNGMLRIGGRLKNANLTFERKHPILLPQREHLVNLIIQDAHWRTFHGGCFQVLNIIRLQFWPINGMRSVKTVIKSCVICRRFNARTTNPLMGNLPTGRITPSRPFSECGVDYAGPFLVKGHNRSGRGGSAVKAYLAIFVCFSTKAIHIEVVSSLTTEAFINALKRFIARRGFCRKIHSDNGTNFVGAQNYLKEWYALALSNTHNSLVHEFCTQFKIEWEFIPARSPHFGGLWEAAVKSVKRHLSKITLNLRLTFEELNTLTTQIESILNSRPLIPLTTNPHEFQCLTPGHFLIGDSLLSLPEPNLQDVAVNRLSRFQLLQQINQHFWKQWSSDYLHLLQTRNKKFCKNQQTPIKIDSLVLIKEPSPPMCWRMGRVTAVHPGTDGIVRVVTLRTSSAVVKRAVTQLVPLLNEDNGSTSEN